MLQFISPEAIKNNQTVSPGHILPKTVRTICPKCNNLSFLAFTHRGLVPAINLATGVVSCNICEQESILILLQGELQDNKLKDFKEMWISPAPKDDRAEAPQEVDEDFRKDFREAVLCLDYSPRASAVLSRYCLQKLLRKKAGVKKGQLYVVACKQKRFGLQTRDFSAHINYK